MTDKNEKKKKTSWINSFTQSILDQDDKADEVLPVEEEKPSKANTYDLSSNMQSSEKKDLQAKELLFDKSNKDKVSLDLIAAVENFMKDRDLTLYKNKGLDNQLFTANENIRFLKKDQEEKENIIARKNKQILDLESNLTNKQMAYDQVLEDYKEFKTISTLEQEKLSIQIDKEVNKYATLNEEYVNNQYQNMLKINELEGKLRNLEIENHQFEKDYKLIKEEKQTLLESINDFTGRMSFSLSPKIDSESKESE